MAISRRQKEEMIGFLQDQVAIQKSVVFLTTNSTDKTVDSEVNFSFRKDANDKGARVKVIKNTLIKSVFPDLPELVGQTYVTFLRNSEDSDEITLTKSIVDPVTKEYKENFQILGSYINGEFMDPEKTVALSKVPSLQDSMSMVAGTLQSITSRIAVSIKEVPSGIARGLNAHSQKNN